MQFCPKCRTRNYPVIKVGVELCGNPHCGTDLVETQVNAAWEKIWRRLLANFWKELGLTMEDVSDYRCDLNGFWSDYGEELSWIASSEDFR